ncbi:unnamed protein product [marine sediment metagenome]|uniref:Uncharacterized protein n=1 Tax=marine sediment metagenome TaxID=412755 RepID=X0Z674_9ZZZZ
MSDVKVNYHSIVDEARKQAKWFNDNIKQTLIKKSLFEKIFTDFHCEQPESHLSFLVVVGGIHYPAAWIYYKSKKIDVHNKKLMPFMKKFADKFGYKSIELYEKDD